LQDGHRRRERIKGRSGVSATGVTSGGVRVHHDTVIQYHQMRFRTSPLHGVLAVCAVGCFAGLFLLIRSEDASPEAVLSTGGVAVCGIGVALCFHRLRRGAAWFVVDAGPGPQGPRRTYEEVRRRMRRWWRISWAMTISAFGLLVMQFLRALLEAGLPDSWKLFSGAMALLSTVSLVLMIVERRVNLADEIVKGMTDPRIQRAARNV